MKRLGIAAILFAVSSVANAYTPTTGFWYNPSESGRGLTIETQNNTMVVASYVYNSSGTPIWYISAGTYDENAQTFNGAFGTATGGQCFGCPYTPPVQSGNAGGPMRIVFTSSETGILYFTGGSTPIEHFNFGYAGKQGYLQGEWSLAFDISGLVDSQWINFVGTYTGSDGTIYEKGVGDGDATILALGGYQASTDTFFIVVDDGVGYSHSYQLRGDDTHMLGLGWIEPMGTPISGGGSGAAANRILTPSELASTGGPGGSRRSAAQMPDGMAVRWQDLEETLRLRIASHRR